jgi:hypothetical protein
MQLRQGLSALALVTTMFGLAPPSAQAEPRDRFSATRSAKLVERAHRIRIVFEGDHARLHVEREVFNGGPRPDQAVFTIRPPSGGVATRLRTLAELDGKPTWFEGELMEAEAAAAKYRELTGIGGYFPKDPALLSWRSQDKLALQVFPCMPGVSKKVDYELVVPTSYEEGRWVLDLPAMGTKEVAAVATVEVGEGGERVQLDGRSVSAQLPIRLDRARRFELVPRTAGLLSGGLASVELSKDRHAVDYHVEAAPVLSHIPEAASIVLAFDASRSLTETQRDASIVAARAYLKHFRGHGARVAITSFARRARDHAPGFVDVETALRVLESLRLEQENGSEIGQALVRARSLLDAAPAARAKRLVVFSDLETRSSLDRAGLRTHLGPGTTLHFATVDQGGSSLRRDDVSSWAALPRSTGGLLWQANAPLGTKLTADDHGVFEELARPVKLDRVVLDAQGGPLPAVPKSLREGEGLSATGITKSTVDSVSFSGELWSTPVRHSVMQRPGDAERWSAAIFGTELVHQLTEAEMMPLAMRGGAVSPVTSYLAIEPGVRPSFEGLEEGEAGTGMGFGSGSGRASTVRYGSIGRPRFDFEGWLRPRIAAAASKCQIVGAKIDAKLETTRDEIVDVTAQLSPPDPKKLGCLVEGVWAIELSNDFDESRASYAVSL